MAGPGVRAWELSRALAREHSVTLAVPAPVPGDAPGFRCVEGTAANLEAEAARHDVVIVQGSALGAFAALADVACPLVIDLYDPYVVETGGMQAGLPPEVGAARVRDDAAVLRRQLALGDAFLCASASQRLFWLGALAAAGRVNPLTLDGDPALERLLLTVPFGLPDDPPPETALPGVPGLRPDGRLVLWGGGIWNWLDPQSAIRAVAEIAPALPDVQLLFMGSGHPNPSVPQMRRAAAAHRLAEQLGVLGGPVLFHAGWTPYAERAGLLRRATVGISLHDASVEAEVAFRTRVLDYLWAGLPCLLTAGEATASLAAAEGFGLTVPPGDQGAVTAALRRLLEDPDLRARCRSAAERVAPGYRWSAVAEPLVQLCRRPARAADLPAERRRGEPTAGGRRGPVARAFEMGRHEGPRALSRALGRRLRRRFR
jgi:glycosyltransferase involved in cell wall biosynthesis